MSAQPANPTDKLLIRPIEPGDAAQAAILIHELGYDRAESDVASWIDSLPRRSEHQSAFVACIGDQVVGWIEISIEHRLQSPPFALIGGLTVRDGYRNQNIGLRLCQHAEAWSRQRGVSKVRVTSRSTRPDAHRFYLRSDYQLTKISHVFEKILPG